MSGTHLFYNGVLLRDCDLREWDQVFERDQSDTDLLFNRVRITVASTLVSLHSTNPEGGPPLTLNDEQNSLARQHLSTIAIPSVDGETVVDRMIHIQRQLQEPRKDFWLAINAVSNKPLANNQSSQYTPADIPDNNDSYRVALAATGIDTFSGYDPNAQGRVVEGKLSGPISSEPTTIDRDKVIDLNNGPKPMNVRVERISGGRAMQVVFTIEVCRRLCPPPNNNPPTGFDENGDPNIHPVYDAGKVEGVISNRWNINETMNENWETSHNITGTLRVSDHRYKPHAMRLVVSPDLFPFGRMARREFGVDKTGLVLEYSFEIQESGYAPPPGVIHWSGSFTESTTIANSQRLGDLQVTVRATHKTPDGENRNAIMLDALHFIARSRIAGMTIQAPFGINGDPKEAESTATMQKISITEQLGKPELTLRASVLFTDSKLNQWKLRIEKLGEPMVIDHYDHRYWPAPEAYPWQQAAADDESAALGSYFDQYFQTPCSQWHATPRGFNVPDSVEVDRTPPPVGPMTAIDLPNIDPTVGLNRLPAVQGANHSWSSEQLSKTTYLSWDGDDTYQTDVGVLHLPLSKPRGSQTSVTIPVHAGLARRVLTVVASRLNKEPEIPRPQELLSNASGLTERLLHHTLVAQNAELQSDGVTLLHSIKIAYEYGLSRPVVNSGYSQDVYRRPSSPMHLSVPDKIQLEPIKIESTGKIETA